MLFKIHYYNAPELTEDRRGYLDGNMRQVDLTMGLDFYRRTNEQITAENIVETHTIVSTFVGNEETLNSNLNTIFELYNGMYGEEDLVREISKLCLATKVKHSSMSVGDIIEVVEDGKNRLFFVDRIGFTELTQE